MPDTTIEYGARTADMQAYMAEGEARAMALGNRGPITFTDDGALSPDILESLLADRILCVREGHAR